MFVKQNKSWKGTLLTFTIGYRENGKTKHKNIETIGYLHELKKTYKDPIAHFRKIAKTRSNNEVNEFLIKNINTKTIDESSSKKNLGYVILKQLYYELSFKTFFNKNQAKLNIEYNLSDIFEFLIYFRILYPGSKKENFENKNIFFDDFVFGINDLYRSLDYFNLYKQELLSLIWNNTKDKYNRDTSKTYYDCTNYYFEISYNDEDLIDEEGNILEKGYRKKGPSKEHRKTPIIQMGLLMDNSGIPMTYDLFPGNESEKEQLRPTIKQVKNNFALNRIITVADRGLNTSDNAFFTAGKNYDDNNMDGYIFGQSVIGADKEFREWVLKQDYLHTKETDENGNEFIWTHKSRIFGKTVQIKRDGKRTNKVVIYQKQLAYYSEKYAKKQKKDRELAIAKAKDLITNPGKYNKATSYGVTAYINNLKFVKTSGEIADGLDLSLKLDKITEEEKYDGYYAIVTSEKEMGDKEIRDIYKSLWEIEETFKISKTNLESRPVYVWTLPHIEAHFLTCFVSLVMIRLLEHRTNSKYTPNKLIQSLKNYTSTKIEHDIYLQDFTNDCLKDLEKIFNVDLSKKYLTLSKIKNYLSL
jgi:transposase